MSKPLGPALRLPDGSEITEYAITWDSAEGPPECGMWRTFIRLKSGVARWIVDEFQWECPFASIPARYENGNVYVPDWRGEPRLVAFTSQP